MHALRQYGKEYIALEEAAHQAHKGMWQGSFEMPADWRKDQKIDKLLAQRGESLQPKHTLPSQAYVYIVENLSSARQYSCDIHLQQLGSIVIIWNMERKGCH